MSDLKFMLLLEKYPVTVEIGDENTGIVLEVNLIAHYSIHEDEVEIHHFTPASEIPTTWLELLIAKQYTDKVDKSQIEDAIVQKVFVDHEDDRGAYLHDQAVNG